MRKLNNISLMIVLLTFCAIVIHNECRAQEAIPVYQWVEIANANELLIEDASILGLDISNKKMEYDHRGWYVISTDFYQIEMQKQTGYFNYFIKRPVMIPTPYNKETIDIDSINSKARAILLSFGIPQDEIETISVKRLLARTEDKLGNAIGQPEVVNYYAYCTRKIGDISLRHSYAKAMFDTSGQLIKIQLYWRPVQRQSPLVYRTKINEQILGVKVKELLSNEMADYSIHKSFYAFYEDHNPQKVGEINLMYITLYSSPGGKLKELVIPATE
ncbi:MAG: hypothetical protein GX444_07105 [Myxococcales bacterium]|nr:hypothetical protein [Myxococcales bacterium]